MTDREMIELAALAAGLVIEYQNGVPCVMRPGSGWPFPLPWNPLEDDGDSRRLEVKLRLNLEHEEDSVIAWHGGLFGTGRIPNGDDPCAATRLAVLRAAVDIGKTMKGGAA